MHFNGHCPLIWSLRHGRKLHRIGSFIDAKSVNSRASHETPEMFGGQLHTHRSFHVPRVPYLHLGHVAIVVVVVARVDDEKDLDEKDDDSDDRILLDFEDVGRLLNLVVVVVV